MVCAIVYEVMFDRKPHNIFDISNKLKRADANTTRNHLILNYFINERYISILLYDISNDSSITSPGPPFTNMV